MLTLLYIMIYGYNTLSYMKARQTVMFSCHSSAGNHVACFYYGFINHYDWRKMLLVVDFEDTDG